MFRYTAKLLLLTLTTLGLGGCVGYGGYPQPSYGQVYYDRYDVYYGAPSGYYSRIYTPYGYAYPSTRWPGYWVLPNGGYYRPPSHNNPNKPPKPPKPPGNTGWGSVVTPGVVGKPPARVAKPAENQAKPQPKPRPIMGANPRNPRSPTGRVVQSAPSKPASSPTPNAKPKPATSKPAPKPRNNSNNKGLAGAAGKIVKD